MADVAVTASAVELIAGSPNQTGRLPAMVAVTAGQIIGRSGQGVGLVSADFDSQIRDALGIALNSASAGQPVSYAQVGVVQISNADVMTIGMPLFAGHPLAGGAGSIVPYADLAIGAPIVMIGFAITRRRILLAINNTGIPKA